MKRVLSIILSLAMILAISVPTFAAGANTSSLESEAVDRIEQIVSLVYSDSPGQYEIKNAVPIYNADMVCVYYIIPIFRDQECVGTVELDASGNVTLTDEVTLYTNITELSSPAYLLYTSGGIVYAEFPGEVVELYDSGFDIPSNNDFTTLPYTDKVALAETCLETANTSLDISAVIKHTELTSIVVPDVSLFEVVPVVESKNCPIKNFITQSTYNLCWAACVATIANYKKGYTLTAEQVATAMGHKYTSPNYNGASTSDTVSALSLYGLSYSSIGDKLSWARVKSNINSDCPFIIGITSINGGHMLAGYGYECKYGDAEADGNLRYVHVWDPNGAKRTLQYYASSYSIYGYAWRWTETLVD